MGRDLYVVGEWGTVESRETVAAMEFGPTGVLDALPRLAGSEKEILEPYDLLLSEGLHRDGDGLPVDLEGVDDDRLPVSLHAGEVLAGIHRMVAHAEGWDARRASAPARLVCGGGPCFGVAHLVSDRSPTIRSRLWRPIADRGFGVPDFSDGYDGLGRSNPNPHTHPGWGAPILWYPPTPTEYEGAALVDRWRDYQRGAFVRARTAWIRGETLPPRPGWAARLFEVGRPGPEDVEGRRTWAALSASLTTADFVDEVPPLSPGLDLIERARRWPTLIDGVPGTELVAPHGRVPFRAWSSAYLLADPASVPPHHTEAALRAKGEAFLRTVAQSPEATIAGGPDVHCQLGPCYALVRVRYPFPAPMGGRYPAAIKPRFLGRGQVAALDPLGGEFVFLWADEGLLETDAPNRALLHVAWGSFARAYVAWLRGEVIPPYPTWAAEIFAVPMVDQLRAAGHDLAPVAGIGTIEGAQ